MAKNKIAMGIFKRLFHRKKNKNDNMSGDVNISPDIQFFVNFEGVVYGPYSLLEIKEYPLLEDTLITTNTLGGEWYEAKYFECFDDMFNSYFGFRIGEDGTIIKQ